MAALALGAAGALLGTRFVATRESMAFAAFTSVTDAFTGRYARVLRTAFLEHYARSGAPVLPFPWQYPVAGDIYREAVARDRRRGRVNQTQQDALAPLTSRFDRTAGSRCRIGPETLDDERTPALGSGHAQR